MIHKPYPQNSPLGRFVVCSCTWRSSLGGDSREEFAQHLRLVEATA